MNVVDKEIEVALPEHCLALVRTLIRQHAPHHQFFAFGSRVVGSATDRRRVKPHSDLDKGAVVDLNFKANVFSQYCFAALSTEPAAIIVASANVAMCE